MSWSWRGLQGTGHVGRVLATPKGPSSGIPRLSSDVRVTTRGWEEGEDGPGEPGGAEGPGQRTLGPWDAGAGLTE